MISVIVPIYNVKLFLRECINSILRQTYKDLEIILIDDGSTDGSEKICDEYNALDSRIKVIHKANGGLSDARNAGIEIASGDLLTFVDSDDVLDESMIDYLYNLLIESKADISACDKFRIDENGQLLTDKNINPDSNVLILTSNYACMHEYLSNERIDTVAWAKLYKSTLFKSIRFPVGRFHEDVFTTYKTIALSKTIVIGKKPMYGYRVRNSSITQMAFTPKHLDVIYGKIEMLDFITKYYPNLVKYAEANIIYAVNQCSLRMSKARYRDKQTEKWMQALLRKHLLAHLHSKSRLISKLYSIACWISLKSVLTIFSKL